MKTRNTVLAALAALLVSTGTVPVVPASRIDAQQSGVTDKAMDRAKRLEEARQELAKAKAEAAERRLQVEKERKRAEQAEASCHP